MGEAKRQDGDGGVDRMFDSEWLAVVSHDNRYFGYSTEDAVEKAVKMTEERMARHLRERTAALERERDQAMAAYADMVREIESSQAELTRLRAVEELAQRFSGTVFAKAKSYWVIDAETTRMFTDLAEACGRKG